MCIIHIFEQIFLEKSMTKLTGGDFFFNFQPPTPQAANDTVGNQVSEKADILFRISFGRILLLYADVGLFGCIIWKNDFCFYLSNLTVLVNELAKEGNEEVCCIWVNKFESGMSKILKKDFRTELLMI